VSAEIILLELLSLAAKLLMFGSWVQRSIILAISRNDFLFNYEHPITPYFAASYLAAILLITLALYGQIYFTIASG